METYWQKRKTIISGNSIEEFENPHQLEIRDAVENFIIEKNPKEVIDFGCNTGILAYRLIKKGWKGKYVGVDSNNKAIVKAMELNKYPNVNFITNDIQNLNFHTLNKAIPKYEIVYCKDILEHLEYYTDALMNLAYITKKYLIVSFFIKPSDKEIIKQHKDGYHLNQYDRNKLISFVNHFVFKNKTIFENETEELMDFEKLN